MKLRWWTRWPRPLDMACATRMKATSTPTTRSGLSQKRLWSWKRDVDPILDDVFLLNSSDQMNSRFSLWRGVCDFFPVLILVAGVLYFFPSCFFLFWLESWICGLDGSSQTWHWSCGSAGIQFHVEGFSIVAHPPESLVELATWWVIYDFKGNFSAKRRLRHVEAINGHKKKYSSFFLLVFF